MKKSISKEDIKMFDLETQIQSWSDHLRAHGNLSDADIHELENHLRDEIEDFNCNRTHTR